MIIKPPQDINQIDKNKKTIFLAGSIEMGVAELWQDHAGRLLQDKYHIYNPRRDARGDSRKQDYDDLNFHQQVNRELDALTQSDYIIMYFDPNTKSPISLLELGLFADSGKIYICCPEGFRRKGNVEAVCDRCQIPLYEKLDQIIDHLNAL